jgi:uncharacterized RmlC-like cupin family protein
VSEGQDCYLVHGDDRSPDNAPTPGMHRVTGIDSSSGASRIWIGEGTAVANTVSAKHHHGEAETASYIVSGRLRVYWGDDYAQYIEAGPGDFLFVPAHVNHYEECLEDVVSIVSRSPANIVVNLE